MADPLEAWRGALTCEVAWTVTAEQPHALAAVPLVLDDQPCVALPYALADRVSSLRVTGDAAFVLSDPDIGGGTGFALTGPCEVVDDVLGERYTDQLLAQEVVKYPPSRVYADTPLLRRENWWWLPRIVVRMQRLEDVRELPVRTDPARHALLVRHDGHRLRVDVAAPAADADWSGDAVRLTSPSGTLRGDGARVVALGHQHTVPDLERWESWYVHGTLRGDDLMVTARDGEPLPDLPPLGLWQRVRRQRALERACKRGIAAAERRMRGSP